jgi:heme/copper-type cytochrome/quinol oxidase subunit 4
MMEDNDKKRQGLDFSVIAATVALSTVLISTFLPKEVTISPLLLFAIIFMANAAQYFIPGDIPKKKVGIFDRVFFARLLISYGFAGVLFFISRLAHNV